MASNKPVRIFLFFASAPLIFWNWRRFLYIISLRSWKNHSIKITVIRHFTSATVPFLSHIFSLVHYTVEFGFRTLYFSSTLLRNLAELFGEDPARRWLCLIALHPLFPRSRFTFIFCRIVYRLMFQVFFVICSLFQSNKWCFSGDIYNINIGKRFFVEMRIIEH